VRAQDLDLQSLLEFDPQGGVIRFAGERALILDAVALGLLRRELIDRFGLQVARGVLTRFGYAHGWRTAELLEKAYSWDSAREWRVAGGRLHRLSGQVVMEPIVRPPGEPAPFAESLWHDSYEAEQHLLHLGQADEPVCWTLTGFASGYLSRVNGEEIYCAEVRCRGRGDAVCRMEGRRRAEWGERAEALLPYFHASLLNETLERLAQTVKAAERALRARHKGLGGDPAAPEGLVASSKAMQRAVDLARRASKVDATVLVAGESGVGKERLAQLVHQESARVGGPFLAINCAAVSPELLESELFGHARGAFTGAVQDRPGLFEAAAGGTLLLDEVGEMPLGMQVKLLRALQEREVRRVGENKSRAVNVRMIAATNRDLTSEVAQGRFRQDLYYRLKVIEIRVPPLRERREDILPLARSLLAQAAARVKRPVSGLSPQACAKLLQYAWPGNVRELQNAMERAVALTSGARVEEEDLPDEVRRVLPGAVRGEAVRTLAEVERDYILSVLETAGGNRGEAARRLGIGTATLYRKLKAYRAG
jgi:two-component system, NtrC family, response regulator HydG